MREDLKEKENYIKNLENSKDKKIVNFEVKMKEVEKENIFFKNQIKTYEEEIRFNFLNFFRNYEKI